MHLIVNVFDDGFISSTARVPSGIVPEELELWSPLHLCTRFVLHDFIDFYIHFEYLY